MRNEYPQPQQKREIWQALNGAWEFSFGEKPEVEFPLTINVPFAYQCKASGIGDTVNHDFLWYRKKFTLNEAMQSCKTVYLNFLAVDHSCKVWVNGKFAVSHEGGYGAFGTDITEFLLPKGEQTIEVYVKDDLTKVYPRGKQTWLKDRHRCWYYPTSGIWQSVWLDGTNGDYITALEITPDVKTTSVCIYAELLNDAADEIWAEVSSPFGKTYKFLSTTKDDKRFQLLFKIDKPDCIEDGHLWSPEHPHLFQTKITVKKDGQTLDEVQTYFAFRNIYTEDGKFYLNGVPYEMRLVLNQSYWEGYGMTAPSAESYKKDILLAMEMGFNGMRVHQKVDDPYLYYYADQLGCLIWAETPSAYNFRPEMIRSIMQTQTELIKKVYNHPSVIAYVPLNESWGVKEIMYDKKQQALAKSLYWLCKSLDDTRLVIGNDGWENISPSDLITVHNYSKYGDNFTKYLSFTENLEHAGRRVMVQGEHYCGQPIMMSEFGGVSLQTDSGWGYNGAEVTVDDFMQRFERLFANMSACNFCGWCYTQLTDVEQETNGLLDDAHKPKFDVKKVREIIIKYGK